MTPPQRLAHPRRAFLRRACAGLSLLPLLPRVSTEAVAADRITGRSFATRSEVIARHGMAATSQPLATIAALDILKRGGTAVDAAIAANAVLGVVEPVGCGVGGDLFAIVWEPKRRRLHGLNASGRSPQLLTLKGLQSKGLQAIPPHGPLPVSVPGAVDGWFQLHKRFGALRMSQVLAPAIETARDGFPVSELIAYYWAKNAAALQKYPNFRATFMPGGRAPKKGEVFANQALARTYEALATSGRDAFYRGALADVMDRYMTRVGGFLRKRDLEAHRSEWVTPVKLSYRGYDVWELPPNGQGIAALQILGVLAGYDLRSMGLDSPEYLHLLIEAKKLAFADRAKFYADPAFHELPVEGLISRRYARLQRQRIGARAARVVDAGDPKLERGDTTYLTVADSRGMMVSLIQSNYRGMGSGMVPDGLGFGFQDRGELFSLTPGHFNCYAPRKRPFHTIIPAFVTRRGAPWLSFGVMGGAAQPQMHAQVLINLIDFDMNLQEAGDAPRMLHLGSSQPTGERMTDGGTVYLERGFSPATERGLIERGHRLGRRSGGFGGYQAIAWDAANKVYVGASESRKDGMAAGY